MVADFSQEELVLPKAFVVGVAKVSAGLVAAINDGRVVRYSKHRRDVNCALEIDVFRLRVRPPLRRGKSRS
jgi:hypothetical protein